MPKRLSVRAEANLTYALEEKEYEGDITWPLPFPNLVAGWNWSPVSLEAGLGGFPGLNWVVGARARPFSSGVHSLYFGTQAQFSAHDDDLWLWYQSVECGYELATNVGLTLPAGLGMYFHVKEYKSNWDSPVTPMGRVGVGWAFIDP